MKSIPAGAVPGPFLLLCLLCLGAARPAASADVVSVVELPQPENTGPAGVSNIAADGTVVGAAFPSAGVVRWKPGQAPEILGGDTFTLDNILPLISVDGSVIVAASYFPNPDNDPNLPPITKPGIWRGGTTWEPIAGTMLESSTPFGMSDNGTFLVGSGFYDENPPNGEVAYPKAWIWSAAMMQIVLGDVPDLPSSHAWGVADDGSVAVGYATLPWPDDRSRYGVAWNADGTAQRLEDGQGRSLGQAVACNSDCSVIVGAGSSRPDASNQAWRRTAQGVNTSARRRTRRRAPCTTRRTRPKTVRSWSAHGSSSIRSSDRARAASCGRRTAGWSASSSFLPRAASTTAWAFRSWSWRR